MLPRVAGRVLLGGGLGGSGWFGYDRYRTHCAQQFDADHVRGNRPAKLASMWQQNQCATAQLHQQLMANNMEQQTVFDTMRPLQQQLSGLKTNAAHLRNGLATQAQHKTALQSELQQALRSGQWWMQTREKQLAQDATQQVQQMNAVAHQKYAEQCAINQAMVDSGVRAQLDKDSRHLRETVDLLKKLES